MLDIVRKIRNNKNLVWAILVKLMSIPATLLLIDLTISFLSDAFWGDLQFLVRTATLISIAALLGADIQIFTEYHYNEYDKKKRYLFNRTLFALGLLVIGFLSLRVFGVGSADKIILVSAFYLFVRVNQVYYQSIKSDLFYSFLLNFGLLIFVLLAVVFKWTPLFSLLVFGFANVVLFFVNQFPFSWEFPKINQFLSRREFTSFIIIITSMLITQSELVYLGLLSIEGALLTEFDVILKVAAFVNMPLMLFNPLFMPRIKELLNAGNEKFHALYSQSCAILGVSSFLALLFVAVCFPFIYQYFLALDLAFWDMLIYCGGIMVSNIMGPAANVLKFSSLRNGYILNNVLTIIVTIAGLFVIEHIYGLRLSYYIYFFSAIRVLYNVVNFTLVKRLT